jgi:hypothetical protein
MTKLQILAVKEIERLAAQIDGVLLKHSDDMGKYADQGSGFNEVLCLLRRIEDLSKAITAN